MSVADDSSALLALRDDLSSPVEARLLASEGTRWDVECDVLVIGFGLAGASAAIEAADRGLDVVLIDRFQGGGSSEMSGGVVYAGGGTPVQQACGIADTPAAMADYLRHEVAGTVADETVQRFCEAQSVPCLFPNVIVPGSPSCDSTSAEPRDSSEL